MAFSPRAVTLIDSYKLSHPDMFPKGTTHTYTHLTPRSMKYFDIPSDVKDNCVVSFGIQAFLIDLTSTFSETFFNVPFVGSEYERLYAPFAGANGFNSDRLRALHELGYLPLKIKAIPEGMLVPVGVPILTITNTHPDFFWLPNFLETWLSADLWKGITSATTALAYRRTSEKYAELTGGSKEFIQWQCHDFSSRGMSGIRDAGICGAGHLLSFTGTDNITAVEFATQMYQGGDTFIGGSIPASEHSVTCSNLLLISNDEYEANKRVLGPDVDRKTVGEYLFIKRMITEQFPAGNVSLVADSFDYWTTITKIAPALKDEILNRIPDEFGMAKVVFRPDSGDPVDVICGKEIISLDAIIPNTYGAVTNDQVLSVIRAVVRQATSNTDDVDRPDTFLLSYQQKLYRVVAVINQEFQIDVHEITRDQLTAEERGSIECLAETFGTTTNEKGFKTLNQRVGLIYGDSITLRRQHEIFKRLAAKGFASDNIVFGVGSFTYNYVTRDTTGMVVKCSYIVIDGQGHAVYKEPKTDAGKKSARGLLQVVTVDGKLELKSDVGAVEEEQGELHTVFLDGEITKFTTFAEIRDRLKSQI